MPRQGLNRRKVLEAALWIVDEEGLEELTMRRLAQLLGVEAPSLYKHVAAKEDILSGIAEGIYEELEIVDPEGCFRERVRQYANSCRDALLRHPNAMPILATRPVTGATASALVASAMAQLDDFGFDAEEGRRFLNVAFNFIVGHALAEVGAERRERAETRAPRDDGDGTDGGSRTRGSGPVDRDAEFELGIDLLVSGFQDKAAGIRTDLRPEAGEDTGVPPRAPEWV